MLEEVAKYKAKIKNILIKGLTSRPRATNRVSIYYWIKTRSFIRNALIYKHPYMSVLGVYYINIRDFAIGHVKRITTLRIFCF